MGRLSMSRSNRRTIPFIMSVAFFLCVWGVQAGSVSGAEDLTVYGDALSSGWADWSWNTARDLSNSSPVHSGTHSIAVTYNGGWAGLYLHSDSEIDLSGYDQLSFRIH